MLIVAAATVLLLAGCDSTLGNEQLEEKIQMLTKNNEEWGSDAKLIKIISHTHYPLQDIIVKIGLGSSKDKGDEVWTVAIQTSKWKITYAEIHRRGKYFWIEVAGIGGDETWDGVRIDV